MPLLAFASPWMLWGLALGAAPILIHLLNRRKFKETQWAAMRFLLAAVRKNSRRLRIEQLILLAVRTLLVLLVALALAEPAVKQLGAFFTSAEPTHRIIVVDASLSMGLQLRETTLFERAKDIAREIVEAAPQGDAFNVVRLSNIPPELIVPVPSFQAGQVLEEIEQMQLPHGRGNLYACLQKAEELLKAAPDLARKEIYLISDFQRATWTADAADENARRKVLLRKLGEAGRLVLIDVGQTEPANMGVSSLEALDSFRTTMRPARFRATVRNYGLERVTGRMLEFLVDERLIEQRALEINAGAEAVEAFSTAFPTGGEHRVQVRLQRDALPLDDQRWVAAPVRDRVRVLLVNGRTANRALGKATDFVELALSPAAETSAPGLRRPPAGQIEPVVVNEGELAALDLTPYDCVFFCDVGLFTDREARLIETYLRGGGGVVWCLGENVRSERYDEVLYKGGAGVLPARLGDRRGNAEQHEQSFAFAAGNLHPIADVFQGNSDAGLETTRTYAYIQATLPPGGRSRIALAFDNGDPAIVETSIGQGRSVLITTSVDDRWGLWPLWPSFVPLIHEVVQFAVSGRDGERQRLVGEPLSAPFPAMPLDIDVLVTAPDGQTRPARVSADEGLSRFVFDDTSQSGIYEVSYSHPLSRTELYAVNVDPRESNLTKLVPEEISQELLPGVDHEYTTSWTGQAAAPIETPVAERGGLTRWLLYAVLYLLFAEQLLAWDFRKGLWLLCPPLILAERLGWRGQFPGKP